MNMLVYITPNGTERIGVHESTKRLAEHAEAHARCGLKWRTTRDGIFFAELPNADQYRIVEVPVLK